MPETFTVSAADANRHFSKLLRAVREGARVTVTSRGHPVAEMAPPGPPVGARDSAAVLAAMEQRWAQAEPMIVGSFSWQVRR